MQTKKSCASNTVRTTKEQDDGQVRSKLRGHFMPLLFSKIVDLKYWITYVLFAGGGSVNIASTYKPSFPENV